MAHPTRFKRDAHLQGCAAGAYSTCHAGLLASVARGFHGAAHSGEVPPETRHHTQVAVVFVECSSRTLPKSWQLCRKCTNAPLRGARQGFLIFLLGHNPSTQEFPEKVSDVPV